MWVALSQFATSPHQRPYNAHAERRQGIAHPQHQQKFAKEEHCVHSQRADEQIDQLPSGKGFRVAVHDAQQDGGSHFQQSHQQNFQQAKGGFARKQAAALLQGVEEGTQPLRPPPRCSGSG